MRIIGLKKSLIVAAVLAAISVSAGKLPWSESQLEARHHARAMLKGDSVMLTTHTAEWDSGLKLNPPDGQKYWDLSGGRILAVDVENLSKDKQLRLTMHISSGSKTEKNLAEVNTGIGLNPGEKRSMRLYLPHAFIFSVGKDARNKKTALETDKINPIEFKLQWPFEPQFKGLVDCRLSNFRLEGKPELDKKISADQYMPFIDVYGQYKHSDWPEKVKSDADLIREHRKELAGLAQAPAPSSWNSYGGWVDGPQLEATGNFRTEKYQGKWFLVDPEGRLFWSTGLDVLRTHTDATNGRKHPQWFSQKVPADGTLPFTHWNLQKKYGKENYEQDFFELLARRLKAWGINTIGNWGANDFMLMGKMPYTMQLADFDRSFPLIEGSKLKFYDVFHPDFELKMGNILRDRAKVDTITRKSINDPMCIGYFIDNELKFGDIIREVIAASPKQPAKVEFINDQKQKYGSVKKLNAAWKSDFKDWDAVAENKKELSNDNFKKDTREFYKKYVNRYFEICRQGVKSAAPHRLYLGSRFVGFRQAGFVWEAAAKHCDVISVNVYSHSVANCNPADFRDKPVIIGEFHFGTYNRGMFSASLCPAGISQEERATAYLRFMQGALVHPNMVGAHWFQFRDQPLTGRWDGEGYQIGFVDVADTPYPEMTDTAREIGENMYQYRLRGKLVNDMK